VALYHQTKNLPSETNSQLFRKNRSIGVLDKENKMERFFGCDENFAILWNQFHSYHFSFGVSVMSEPTHLTEDNFQAEVLDSDKPVLVDFWAAWCGPCRMIAPVIEEIARDYDGKAKIGKLDVDNNQRVAMQYGIRSIPALLIFQGGKVVDQIIGAVPKSHITAKLDAIASVN
jgi:thioredoxin 1